MRYRQKQMKYELNQYCDIILDISTLCSNDTLRVLVPDIRGSNTPPYNGMRIKEKKKMVIGRKRGERKMDK